MENWLGAQIIHKGNMNGLHGQAPLWGGVAIPEWFGMRLQNIYEMRGDKLYPSIHLSVYLHMSLSVYLPVYLSYLSIYAPIQKSIYLCLSVRICSILSCAIPCPVMSFPVLSHHLPSYRVAWAVSLFLPINMYMYVYIYIYM